LSARQFIAGDRYTVADITLQCTLIVAKNVGIRIPEDHSNLTRWFSQVSARPTARA
jgi:glutathione S-transferase